MESRAMFDLSGRTALVTGASGGIGGAIARQLHAQGAKVVLTGRRRDALDGLAAALAERVAVEPADLAEPDAPDRLVRAVEGAGALDILVNNAGLTRDNLALRLKDEDWQAVLEVNLSAGFRLIRSALRGMIRRRYGRILNITSIVAVTGNPGQANYAAAKAGLIGMSKALAAEVAARGITVNCIAPGFIETAMTEALGAEQRASLLQQIPIGRLGTGADVAAAAGYLASAEAAYVTGQTLHVNGGMAMV
jgi:3-oxoacyl-[acyl-carrier protein] reductase